MATKKPTNRWTKAANQEDILDTNWEAVDREKIGMNKSHLFLYFRDNFIRFQTHVRDNGGLQIVTKDKAEVSNKNVPFYLKDVGCCKCKGAQIYEVVLQEKDNERRLQVNEYALCHCGDGYKWNRFDNLMYTAVPVPTIHQN